MRILLIHRHAPDDPARFDWTRLVENVSTSHEVRLTWWVVTQRDRLEAELAAGVMTTDEFEAFRPDLLLIDRSPDARVGRSARKVPWELEQRFRSRGGAIIFLRPEPDMNDPERNRGYAEYGFPLATSRGRPVYLAGMGAPNRWIGFSHWKVPSELLPSRAVRNGRTLGEVVIDQPWVLNDGPDVAHRGLPLFWAPFRYDVKDPLWRYENDLDDGVRKPYRIGAWIGGTAPLILLPGDILSDYMISEGDNEALLNVLVSGIEVLQAKREMVTAGWPNSRPTDSSAVTSTRHVLPFNNLDSKAFERLCLWLVREDGFVVVEHYGLSGGDAGRDVVARRGKDGEAEVRVFQCKRRQRVTTRELLEDLAKVPATWDGESVMGIVFVVTCAISARARDAVRSAARERGLGCELWGISEIDERVKRNERVLKEFFSVGARPQVPPT